MINYIKIRKKTLGLIILLITSISAFSQEKIKISGKITDGKNQLIPYASVTFLNKTNSAFSDAALTDDKGEYQLQLVSGNYDITIEAIDFKTITLNKDLNVSGNSENFILTKDNTSEQSTEIQEVTLTATVKPYKVELDKRTYDPSQDIISKGGNLQDVLSNVPSVEVDTDGTVSMRGNSNIKFLINGKPSALLGIDDGADALKSIPADQIEKIEVITNPSSKYEASGTAGILNIILKKNKKTGFNGSITGNLGYLPRTSLNTNLSWRKNNWTWFLNGGGGYNRNKSENNNEYQYTSDINLLEDGQSIYRNQNGNSKGENKNYNTTAGFFVDITEKSALNASVMFRSYNNESTETINTFDRYVDSLSVNRINERNSVRINQSNRKNNSFQADLGFDQKFGDNGELLSLAASFQSSKSESFGPITEEIVYLNGDITNKFNNLLSNSNNKTFLAKADYELPIGENSKFEAGARFDLKQNDYNYFVNESKDGAPFVVLDRFTSDTYYNEKLTAAYALFKSKTNKFGYQFGLRAENSDINVRFKSLENAVTTEVKKNYTGFFPSVFLSYDLNDDSQLLLNYSRRINRPRSWFLIPFMSYSNNLSLFSGNPDLNPTYQNSFEFGYSLSKSKITFNPTLYLKKSDEVNFYQYSGLDEDGTTVLYRKPVNAGDETNYGLDINGTYDPFKWWRIMGSIDLFGYKNTGSYEGFSYNGSGFSTRFRLTNTFKPDKKTSIQIQGFYRGGEKTDSQNDKSMYAVNLGASRTILNGDGTISFNIQDVFNTRSRENTTIAPNYTQYSYMQYQPRQFSISFSYRFKQGEKVEQPKKKKENTGNFDDDEEMPPM
ncbi:MAG: TonB-dependent receptor [Flavobacteriaceae bacterium]|jgi:outer membrane receptor protein involved in Fe transport|nr:TonB-dependent receptor [Flavobacteriaceae bacterium]